MRVCKEEGLRTIAFSCLYTARKGYPREDAAHIGLRTIRRFLEHWGDDIDQVVICVDNPVDLAIYEQILPLYMPRCPEEEEIAAERLPADIGNEHGETVIEDRKIRLTNFREMAPAAADGGGGGRGDAAGGGAKPREPSRMPSAFGKMSSDTDDDRLDNIRSGRMKMTRSELEEERSQLQYATKLRKARAEDLSDIAALNLIYKSGTDNMGRAVIMFVASHLPAKQVDMERVMLYIIRTMDPIVERPYVVSGCDWL
jgi:hypothetical protein